MFVLSDHPVAHYGPEPKTPEAGAGFISSPGSQTWVALDPSFGLPLSPESPGTGSYTDLLASLKNGGKRAGRRDLAAARRRLRPKA